MRIIIGCILASTILFFNTSQATAQTSLLIGAFAAVNTGERPGVAVSIEDVRFLVSPGESSDMTLSFENGIFYNSSQKSTGGWKAGALSLMKMGDRFGVLVGGDFRYRDGGPWVKKSVWGIFGLSKKVGYTEVRLFGRLPVFETAPNNVRGLNAEFRYHKPGSRIGFLYEPGGIVFQDNFRIKTPHRFGYFQNLSLSIQLGSL